MRSGRCCTRSDGGRHLFRRSYPVQILCISIKFSIFEFLHLELLPYPRAPFPHLSVRTKSSSHNARQWRPFANPHHRPNHPPKPQPSPAPIPNLPAAAYQKPQKPQNPNLTPNPTNNKRPNPANKHPQPHVSARSAHTQIHNSNSPHEMASYPLQRLKVQARRRAKSLSMIQMRC